MLKLPENEPLKFLCLPNLLRPAYKITTELTLDSLLKLCSYPGFAYVGGACVVNKRLEKVNSVAIIEDTGGFSGIIVAAHEVGHL